MDEGGIYICEPGSIRKRGLQGGLSNKYCFLFKAGRWTEGWTERQERATNPYISTVYSDSPSD